MEGKFSKSDTQEQSDYSQATCPACAGYGESWEEDHISKSQVLKACQFCKGTGRKGDTVKKVLSDNFDLKK